MAQIQIRHNFSKIAVALQGVSAKDLRRAVSRSIKRVTKTVGRITSQEVRARRLINMKAATLKKRIRIFDHAVASKPVDSQYGEVHISGRPESMAYFHAKAVDAGKSTLTGAKLKRVVVSEQGRPYLEQDRSFLLSRGRGARKVVLTREQGAARLPVFKATGPSLGKLVADSGILNRIEAVATDRYLKEFSHNLEFYSKRSFDKAKLIRVK